MSDVVRPGFAMLLLVAAQASACASSVTQTAVDASSPEDRSPLVDVSSPEDRSPLVDVSSPEDRAMPTDVAAPLDITPGIECRAAIDCSERPIFQPLPICGDRAGWSCIAGRCTFECAPFARTCARDARGCLTCDDGTVACPTDPCSAAPAGWTPTTEMAYCARAFVRELTACFGEFAMLRDGTICSHRDAGTGALRTILACGPCQTSVLWLRSM